MKKGLVFIGILMISILSISFVSAGFWSDLFNWNGDDNLEGELANLVGEGACVDSDGGLNLEIKGSCSDSNGEITDTCINGGFLKIEEALCDNDTGSCYINSFPCPEGCSNGTCKEMDIADPTAETCPWGAICKNSTHYAFRYTTCEWASASPTECPNGCLNGACIKGPPPGCTDTDGGKNFYVKGSRGSEGSIMEDFCWDGAKLWEGYCRYGESFGYQYICPLGCSDGACINSVCSDSDNGNNYLLKGITTNSSANYEDVCDGDVLKEYSCLNDEISFENYDCEQNGYVTCLNGTCIKESESGCTDVDGLDFNSKGNVIVNGENYYDRCVKSFYPTDAFGKYQTSGRYIADFVVDSCSGTGCKLEEKYCDSGALKTQTYDDPRVVNSRYYSGVECNDGKITQQKSCWLGDFDLLSKGEIRYLDEGNWKETRDYCEENYLYEYTCEGRDFSSSSLEKVGSNLYKYSCSNLNEKGYEFECEDGACKRTTPAIGLYDFPLQDFNEANNVNFVCLDTDFGINFYEKGGYIFENYIFLNEDECSGDILNEKYCLGNNYPVGASISYTCPNGCLNGACVEGEELDTCVDSDNGIIYHEKGILNLNGDLYEDRCITFPEAPSSNTEQLIESCSGEKCYLLEYYCSGNTKPQLFKCEEGCQEGVCLGTEEYSLDFGSTLSSREILCMDSDGRDYQIKGSVTNDTSTKEDYCYSNVSLIEHYCEDSYNGQIRLESYDCAEGCEDGICINMTRQESIRGSSPGGGGGSSGGGGGVALTPLKVITPLSETTLPENEGINTIMVDVERSRVISRNTEATSETKLSVFNGKAYASHSSGSSIEIKITPDEATELVKQEVKTETINLVKIIEYKKIIVYEIDSEKSVKVFALIPSNMGIVTKINIESGDIVNVNKPWWGFLAKE
jgi:hypothetical protein